MALLRARSVTMTKRWLPMPRIIFYDTGICFGEPPSVLATIFLMIPDVRFFFWKRRWRRKSLACFFTRQLMGLYSVALPFGLRACVYYTVAGIFENRTGFLSLARHCLRQCREPAAASFQPERKERKKGTKLCERQLGENIHTHTYWGGGMNQQLGLSMVIIWILCCYSVGRSGKKQNNNIRMCARKNRKQPNGKK